LTFEFDLDSVKVNYQAKYLDQTLSSGNAERQTYIHIPYRSHW